jgi:hypothetical protein
LQGGEVKVIWQNLLIGLILYAVAVTNLIAYKETKRRLSLIAAILTTIAGLYIHIFLTKI